MDRVVGLEIEPTTIPPFGRAARRRAAGTRRRPRARAARRRALQIDRMHARCASTAPKAADVLQYELVVALAETPARTVARHA
jgi:hypothetical protein